MKPLWVPVMSCLLCMSTFGPSAEAQAEAHAPTAAVSGAKDSSLSRSDKEVQVPASGSITVGSGRAPRRPIAFLKNLGQADRSAEWEAKGTSFTAHFTRTGFSIAFASDSNTNGPSEQALRTEQRLQFVHASPLTTLEGLDPEQGTYNFFSGGKAEHWTTGVKPYERLRYKELYPGIDVIFYINAGSLEYDFIVSPGADPRAIRMAIGPQQPYTITQQGELVLGSGSTEKTYHTPLLYQDVPHGKKVIVGQFIPAEDNTIGVAFGTYDQTKPLIIDPTITLLYSTYLGGKCDEQGTGLAVDLVGNTYVYGSSCSEDYPVSSNGYQTSRSNAEVYNLILSKFDSSDSLVYSTYLRGSGGDYACLPANGTSLVDNRTCGVAVDAKGNAYITGSTRSRDFPITANAYQHSYPGGTYSAFVSEISADGGGLLYSSFLGGSNGSIGSDLVLTKDGKYLYFLGQAYSDFPTTPSSYMPSLSAASGVATSVVAQLDLTAVGQSQLVASTFYGATSPQSSTSSEVFPYKIRLSSSGTLWVGGTAGTNGLPTTPNAIQQTIAPLNSACQGRGTRVNSAAIIFELTGDLSKLSYGTYLTGGTSAANSIGCNEIINALALDSSDNVYVGGTTPSATFPTTSGAIQKTFPANTYYSGFITKISGDGSKLLYSSYLGASSGHTVATSLAVTADDRLWIGGLTGGGSSFPISTDALQNTIGGGRDGFVTELSSDGATVLYSTYLGGSGTDAVLGMALDSNGSVHVNGYTNSKNFPLSANALQSKFANGQPLGTFDDIFFTVLGSGSVGTFGPVVAGNTGDTTVTVNGSGFQVGATCTLTLGTTVLKSSSSAIGASGTTISCTFALNGAALGAYTLTVTNLDGSTLNASSPLTVKSGSGSKIWVTVVGRPKIRAGVPSTFTVSYGNSGDADAIGVPISVTVPAGVTVTAPEGTLPITYPATLPSSSVPSTYTDDSGNNVAPFIVPEIPTGQSGSFDVQVSGSVPNGGEIPITVTSSPPISDSQQALDKGFSDAESRDPTLPLNGSESDGETWANCAQNAYIEGVDFAFDLLKGLYKNNPVYKTVSCVKDALELTKEVIEEYKNPAKANLNGVISASALTTAASNTVIECALAGAEDEPLGYGIGIAVQIVEKIASYASTVSTVNGCARSFQKTVKSVFKPKVVSSIDPNDKAGPTGDGSSSQFILPSSPLAYSIAFENQPTATAPASQVVVSDQLDTSKVDIASLSLGSIHFGSTAVNVPFGSTNFNTVQPINSSVSVRIQGSVSQDTGLLRWTFTSIDPSTLLPPTDPTVGFLPPDTDGMKGQASVNFLVSPKLGQATGAQLTNAASVVFDSNSAIATPVWLNTIDSDVPSSSVGSLPTSVIAASTTRDIPVTWSGADKGSGVATYDVYVSDNGGAFVLWQVEVANTSATYTGTVGHTYGFYSVATDGAGNSERAKIAAEATVTVIPLNGTTTTLTSSGMSATVGSSITFTATVAPVSGSGTPSGTITFVAGATNQLGTATLISGKATLSTSSLPVGGYSISAVYSGDGSFAGSSSPSVSVTITPVPPDFSISASPASGSISSGGTTTSTVAVGPTGGFNGAVSLACSGLPSYTACSFSPPSITPSGTTAATSNMTITSNPTAAALYQRAHNRLNLAALGGALFLSFSILRKRRSLCLFSILVFTLATAIVGCGGAPLGQTNRTPAGTYAVTVTGTSGATTHTTTFSLTVQ